MTTQEKIYYKHGSKCEINLQGLNEKGQDVRDQLLTEPPKSSFAKHPYLTINTVRAMLDTFFPGRYDQSEGIVKKNMFVIKKPEYIAGKRTSNFVEETVFHVSKRVSLYIPNRENPIVFEIDAAVTQSKMANDESLFGLSANLAARGLKQCCKTLGGVFRIARDDDESIDEFFNVPVEDIKMSEPTKTKETLVRSTDKSKSTVTSTVDTIKDTTDEDNDLFVTEQAIQSALADFPASATEDEKKAKANEIATKYNIKKSNPHFKELYTLVKKLLSL